MYFIMSDGVAITFSRWAPAELTAQLDSLQSVSVCNYLFRANI